VDFLVRRLDTDATLQLHLLDVTPEELAADLAADDDAAIGASGIARLLGESAAAPFALVVGLFALGTRDEDAALAARLARVARLTGTPWVADAHHVLAGAPAPIADCPDPDDWTVQLPPAWRATRRVPDASWLALAAPRVLARLPYGKDGEPCERVPFEELESEDERPAPASHFLWGSASVLAALLVGEAFAEDGWALRPRNEVRGLPLFVRRVAGEPTILPCAEMPMTERAALRLLERGLVPAAWVRDEDAVRLVRLQSIADPPAPLSARWRAGA
jgi:type VI secretion system protein ImpC